MEFWKEFRDNKLTPPCIVQVDGDEKVGYLIWVWTGEKIQGPFSRNAYDEKEVIACAMAMEELDPEEPAEVYTKDQIESILVEKGYITEEEKLEDLKEAEEFISAKTAPIIKEKV